MRYATLIPSAVLIPFFSLFAQTVTNPGVGGVDKRPTPTDPSYQYNNLPPSMRRAQENSSGGVGGLLFNPTGAIDINAFSMSRQKQEEAKEKMASKKFLHEIEDIPGGKERVILEKSIMRQFGMDEIPYQWKKEEPHHESGLRRFQITFFLSLPISMGVTYAVASALKTNAGQSARRYTGPQTAAMVVTGMLFSGGIALYDYSRWKDLPSSHENVSEGNEKESHRSFDTRDWMRENQLPLYRTGPSVFPENNYAGRSDFHLGLSFQF